MKPKENELVKIKAALAASEPATAIIPVCRDILRERLSQEELTDRYLRYLLEDLIDQLDFSCVVRLAENTLPVSGKRQRQKGVWLWGALGVLGLFAAAAETKGFRIVGSLVSLAGGLGLGYSLAARLMPVPNTVSMRLVTTAKDVMERVDAIYGCITAFFNYKQLEGSKLGILRWLQEQYADTESSSYRKSIERLLAQYGYKFENYDPKWATDFVPSTANISEITTTQPLLVDEAGNIILKGHVVFPMMR